ncbi:MAG TPA: hypothetical protein VM901_07195 [Bdellovibrionota bacterium]|jgi:hypothetical protein|nr:hypothetical protein [Bdellovibrionota bacterium]
MNRTLWIIVLSFLSSGFVSVALAGHAQGNGGYAYLGPQGWRLLEFYESGLSATDDEVAKSCDEIHRLIPVATLDRLQNAAPFLNAGEACLLARRLHYVQSQNALLAWALWESLSMYHWRVADIDDTGLVDLRDVKSKLNLDARKLKIVANREGKVILIDQKLFTQLPAYDRVGLVFHELWYSLLEPTPHHDEQIVYLKQDSSLARALTQDTFAKEPVLLKTNQLMSLFRTRGVATSEKTINPLPPRPKYDAEHFYRFVAGQDFSVAPATLELNYGYRWARSEDDPGLLPTICVDDPQAKWCPFALSLRDERRSHGVRWGAWVESTEVEIVWGGFWTIDQKKQPMFITQPQIIATRNRCELDCASLTPGERYVPGLDETTYNILFEIYRGDARSHLSASLYLPFGF